MSGVDGGSLVAARGGPRARQQLVDRARRVILHAREDVGEVVERIDPARLARRDERVEPSEALARLRRRRRRGSSSGRARSCGASARSALLSSGTRASSRKTPSSSHWPSVYRIATPSGLFGGCRSRCASSQRLQALANRPGALFPKLQVCGFGKSLLLRVVLDAIELGDRGRAPPAPRARSSATRRSSGARARGRRRGDARDLLDVVVAAVAVDEQHALRAFEQRLRRRAGAAVGEDDRRRRARPRRRARRRSRRSRSSACRVASFRIRSRVSSASDDVAHANHVEQPRPNRREQRRRAMKQLVHRRARDGDALAREAPSRAGRSADGRRTSRRRDARGSSRRTGPSRRPSARPAR